MTADTLQPVLAQDDDLRAEAERRLMRIVIVGHVDHGKSTLVGRLLNDSGSLPEGRVDAIRAMSERRGMPFEWSFVMDALKAERDQGITIDRLRSGSNPRAATTSSSMRRGTRNS